MSAVTKEILAKVQRIIPPMLDKFHKGQLGRVAVIGGSKDYTGAPYFSAMASAKLGCDMSHVICTPEAAAVVKTYSPNLMVHPLMVQTLEDQSEERRASPNPKDIAEEIIKMFPRLHVLVIGPGLGRDPLMQDTVAEVIKAARQHELPVVLDADALLLVQKNPRLVSGYHSVVLTPNVVEFKRLLEALGLDTDGGALNSNATKQVEMLARALDGVTIIQKGATDLISNGTTTLENDGEGGKKRSGGQGDTLTGSVATFLAWAKAYWKESWDVGEEKLSWSELMQLAAFGGSAITRESSRLAFLKKGRSLQASDLTEEVHAAFMNLFGDVDERDSSKL